MRNSKILIFLFLISACSSNLLKQAEKLYKQKRYPEAAKYFEKYYLNYPKKEKADYAAYYAGLIYSSKLYVCEEAKRSFEFLIKKFPKSQYYQESYFRFFICPNYVFPKYNKFYFGDSESYGKNASELIYITKKDYQKIDFTSKIYAGKKLLKTQKKQYIIDANRVLEKNETGVSKIIINYSKEGIWKYSLNGQVYFAKMVYAGDIKVKAGEFSNCVKVMESVEGSNTKIITYYAPEIGKILTSSLYEDKETRIMELIKYE
ncbi:MAG: hypothetical protein K6357_03525 [Elusimicrobiota bacterium]